VVKYLKVAFTNRWNLLALIGGCGMALLSGAPDVFLPLVLAAEAAYLGLLAGHPKFQKFVDAHETETARRSRSDLGQHTLQNILNSLPQPLLDRYNELRVRCQDLQRIAADLRHPEFGKPQQPLESLQFESLDRLLWLYLRLLFTGHALQKFLKKTSKDRILSDVQRIENRLSLLDPDDASPHTQKLRRTLQDNLSTSQDRIRNHERAEANYEFVELEIDRLENKIKSLAEVAVNRQEPDLLSSQADQVASSMLDTERTMNELRIFTGLGQLDEQVPALLEPPTRSR